MTDLSDLITRLEQAVEPSRELDCLIGYQIHEPIGDAHIFCRSVELTISRKDLNTPFHWECTAQAYTVPRFTKSVTAALQLLPEGWQWAAGTDAPHPDTIQERAWARVFPRHHQERGLGNWSGTTPALALCIACLRARAAQEGKPK